MSNLQNRAERINQLINQPTIAIDTYIGDDEFIASIESICIQHINDRIMNASSILESASINILINRK